MLQLAALTDAMPWPLIVAIAVAILAAIGVGAGLSFLRSLRTNLADEIRREIDSAKSATPIAVQQPLIVKADTGFTPLEKHEALVIRVDGLESEMDKRVAGVSAAAAEGREKIYTQLNTQRELLAKNTEKTDLTFAGLTRLDGKIDRILERMPRPN